MPVPVQQNKHNKTLALNIRKVLFTLNHQKVSSEM